MQELTERVVKVETRLDIQDKRLDAHGNELEELRKQNIVQDSKLDGIDKKLTESCEVTHSIKGGVNTIKWLVGVAFGAYTLYEIATKLGWF